MFQSVILSSYIITIKIHNRARVWRTCILRTVAKCFQHKSSFDSSPKCHHHWTKPGSRPMTGSNPALYFTLQKVWDSVQGLNRSCLIPLSSAEASLCYGEAFVLWGGWGERTRECAGHDGKGEERRETSPAAKSEEKRMLSQAIRNSKYESLHIFPFTTLKYEECRLEFSGWKKMRIGRSFLGCCFLGRRF